ncbi:hypothetical protein [Xanthomarina sp. GH4-25]|uniref:hypothetical protein n=1 Tax=Xanthomarina sp. GH4-25 TaxID=3349335 RepID=UPI000D68385F|nr:hypothetical protein DI383_01425 [Flavobacteriaceae bacterium LYZ1037]
MKTFLLTLSISIFSNSIFSQTVFAKIEKNRNLKANTLFHELNTSKDTLLLKSDTKITHIYSINSKYKRELDEYLNETDLQISLRKLSRGKHVMVVDQSPKKIIFVIHVYGPFPIASIDN